MGRELRRVPANWEHPKDSNGRYIPLYGGSWRESVTNWDINAAQWDKGLRKDFGTGTWVPVDPKYRDLSYAEWDGDRPDMGDYMPDWTESERTHFQMYEDTTEGTPISPVMETPEKLARWLADSGASAFGDSTATYEQWLSTIKRGWAVSMVADASGLKSGVEAMA